MIFVNSKSRGKMWIRVYIFKCLLPNKRKSTWLDYQPLFGKWARAPPRGKPEGRTKTGPERAATGNRAYKNTRTLMTLPNPPLPRNCNSSNSHLTRDFPGTPEKNEKSGTGSSRSGWSTRNDGPSFPATPSFPAASCWPFGKPLEIAEVIKECSSNWEADKRFLSSAFKQLRKRFNNKKVITVEARSGQPRRGSKINFFYAGAKWRLNKILSRQMAKSGRQNKI